jgi:hypothetical protein
MRCCMYLSTPEADNKLILYQLICDIKAAVTNLDALDQAKVKAHEESA